MDDTLEQGRGRWRLTGRRPWINDPVVRAMVVVYPVIRLLAVVGAAPVNAPDSPSYRVRNGNFLNFSLTSLDGLSMRPWGATVWMALWPSDLGILLAQVALSVIAWAALAVTVADAIENRVARRILAFLVLLLSCTAQVVAWDANILSESVSVSTGILALVALIRFTRRPSWWRAVVLVLVALWFTMTRPNVFPVLLAWAVALVVVGLVRRRVVLWGAVGVGFVLISVYAYVYNVRSDDAWRVKAGITRSTIAYAYPISPNNVVAEDVLADLRKSDAPPCMIPATPAAMLHQHGPTAWAKKTAKACPGMDAWATANWTRWWTSWLIHHPSKTAQIIKEELPNALSTPVYADVRAPAPTFVGSMFFGSTAIPQSNTDARSYRTEPLLLWLGAIIALAVLGGRRLRGSWHTDLIVLAGALGALASAISGGLLIQAAPDGVGRESAGVTLLLIGSCLALVGLGLGRLWSGTASDRQHADPVPAPEPTSHPSVAADGRPDPDPAEEDAPGIPREDHPVG